MIFEDIPAIVSSSLIDTGANHVDASRYAAANEDADCLRQHLRQHHLVAFVGNGSILPRRSGVEQTPLSGERMVPFRSPPSLTVSFDVPNAGKLDGMGIPAGVTLVVG